MIDVRGRTRVDKILKSLINAKIIRILKVHDYWQVITYKGIINIYNPIKYCTAEKDYYDLNFSNINNIINKTIIEITAEEQKYLFIKLDNNSSITVSTSSNDYKGPEAFEIHLNTGEIIIG